MTGDYKCKFVIEQHICVFPVAYGEPSLLDHVWVDKVGAD